MNLSILPNLLCVVRMLLAIPVVFSILHGDYGWTLALFFIAAVTDGLDGWLATHFGWTSETGKLLDPIADKLLLVSVFVTLTAVGLVPLWLAVAVVLRDLVIGGGAAAYRLLYGPLNGRPTLPSKLNTLLQICFVLVVVSDAAWQPIPDVLVMVLGASMFVTTVVSGLDYVLTYSRRATEAARASRAPH